MVQCNNTLERETIGRSPGDPNYEVPYYSNVNFHDIGLVISAVTGLIAIIISGYLIFQHALHYSKPWEQKHIIRILFMVPVYALVSFLSYYYYVHTIYWQVLRDCYEAFAIASFFTLLCNYIAPDIHDQKEFFRNVDPKNWILPLNWLQKCTGGQNKGLFRKPSSGLTWFNVVWNCVFQYCFIRVLFTIVSVAAQADDRYCESSLNPAFAHIWALVFESVSVTIAMYGLIQFYVQLKDDLAAHRPFLKLLCIKLVIFFSFWQSTLISFVSSNNGPFRPTDHIAYPDISVGIPAMLLCIEMAIFAVMHVFAYKWRPYRISTSSTASAASSPDPVDSPFADPDAKARYFGGTLGWRAFADAFNPWDIIKACGRGFRWLFVGRRFRKNDVSYAARAAANDEPSYPAQYPGATKLGPVGTGGTTRKTPPATGSAGVRMDDDEERPYRGGLAAVEPYPVDERDRRLRQPRRSFDQDDYDAPTVEQWSPLASGGHDIAGLLRNAAPPAQADSQGLGLENGMQRGLTRDVTGGGREWR